MTTRQKGPAGTGAAGTVREDAGTGGHPKVRPGHVRQEFSLPAGFASRLRSLVRSLQDRSAELGIPPEALQSGGAALSWLVDHAGQWMADRSAALAAIREVERLRAEAHAMLQDAAEAQAAAVRARAAASDAEIGLGVSQKVRGVVAALLQEGLDAAGILRVAEAIDACGVAPEELAAGLREHQGLGGWLRHVASLKRRAADAADAEVQRLATLRGQITEAEAQAAALAQDAIDRAGALSQMDHQAQVVQETLGLLGLRTQWLAARIRAACRGPVPHLALLPPAALATLAGLILCDPKLADHQVTIPPGPGHPLPIRGVPAGDLAAALIPPEVAREQEREALRRELAAEDALSAAGAPPAPGTPEADAAAV